MSKNLECSSRGDKRFSAFYAKLKKYGNQSIETIYQNSKRTEDGRIPGKGRKVAYVVWANKKYPPTVLSKLYEKLWRQYFVENPELLEYAKQFDTFTDMFKGRAINCQADIIAKIVEEERRLK